VVPFVPVVFDGIDEIGMELIGGVQEWIRWIAEKSGREEIVKLSETGERESEVLEGASLVFWKLTFMMLHTVLCIRIWMDPKLFAS
jgi:hypothetical protein